MCIRRSILPILSLWIGLVVRGCIYNAEDARNIARALISSKENIDEGKKAQSEEDLLLPFFRYHD